MEKNEFLDRSADGRMTRRDFHKALASVGLVAAALPLTSRTARANDQATYFTWAGYDIPEIIPGYVEKTGGNPNWPVFGDEEEALTKLRSGYQVDVRSEEHTSELQSLMRISYDVFCLKKKKTLHSTPP